MVAARRQQQQQRFGRGAGDDGPVPVIAALTKRADVPVYLDGVGTIKALNTVTVRSQVDGKLLSVNYTEGQDVDAGLRAGARSIRSPIRPPTIRRWRRRRRTRRRSPTPGSISSATPSSSTNNAIAQQQLDTQKAMVAQLEAQVRLDQAQIDNAKAILDYTTIVAPIAGRTGIRQVDQGNIVHAADATGIVVITQLQPISVLFTLPQQQLGDVNRALRQRRAAGRCIRPRQQDRGRNR